MWLNCTDPEAMLAFLRGRVSDRKLRLFACACCRLIWTSLRPLCCRRAVEAAERYADGLATRTDLDRARSQAFEAAHAAVAQGSRRRWDHPARGAEARLFFAGETASTHQPFPIGRLHLLGADPDLRAASPALLRCVVGPGPFRPLAVLPNWLAWHDGTIPRLAGAIYDDRAWDRLPILADALEEAGCTDADLLGHCRGPGPHVRGCWAVDLLLDKDGRT
jgi:hypothetical protein